MIIGKVSEKFNIPIETLRYYDKIELLTPERENTHRYYTDKDIKKLKNILKMKKMMFTLGEIKNILTIDEKIDKQIDENHIDKEAINLLNQTVKCKYKEILTMEEDIKNVKKHLEHIINKIEGFNEGGNSSE